MRWATCRSTTIRAAPEIFAHCQAIARRYDLYELAVFQTTVTSTVWNEAEQLWHIDTDRGDHMRAQFVICANGTLSKPKLVAHRRHGDVPGALVPHVALGLRLHGRGPRPTSKTRSSASSAPAQPPCRRCPASARTQRSCTCFSARRRRSTCATTGPPIQEWAARLKPGWQAKRRARALTDPVADGRTEGALRRGNARREDRSVRNAGNIDYMMRIHERIESDGARQGDRRSVEAVVHVHVQAAVLPQRLPADVQPPLSTSGRHARQRHHRDQRARPGVRRANNTNSTC